jgi:hypothetical protein
MDPEILEAARKAAEAQGVTLSEYLRELLRADSEVKNLSRSEEGNEGNQDPKIR